MAHRTIEQQESCEQLRLLYGIETRMQIEVTENAYGLVRMQWAKKEFFGEREEFVHPGGKLLEWKTL